MQRIQVRYRGRVQGVGFRATVDHIARGFDVTGRVCNVADGSVLLWAEGEPDELERFQHEIAQRLDRNIDDATLTREASEERRWGDFGIGPDEYRS